MTIMLLWCTSFPNPFSWAVLENTAHRGGCSPQNGFSDLQPIPSDSGSNELAGEGVVFFLQLLVCWLIGKTWFFNSWRAMRLDHFLFFYLHQIPSSSSLFWGCLAETFACFLILKSRMQGNELIFSEDCKHTFILKKLHNLFLFQPVIFIENFILKSTPHSENPILTFRNEISIWFVPPIFQRGLQ